MTAQTAQDRRQQSEQDYRSKWIQYEQRKREWAAKHPHATSEEFEQAVRKIMHDVGL